MLEAPAESRWTERIRAAPLGIVVIAALLGFMGAGLVLGGVYLGLARDDAGWVPWTMALVGGPVVLYLAVHLVRRTPWAWLVLVAVLVMLLLSSVVRAFGDVGFPLSPVVELVVEGLALAYFARPGVRRAFGRGSARSGLS